MEIITSVKNPLVVQTKKIRDEAKDKLFLENPKLINEAYISNLNFDYVLVSKDKYDILLQKFSFLSKLKIILVGENVIEHLSETKKPQGVIAIVNYSQKQLSIPQGNFIVLENLQDPGNLGTIIRSAKGTNFKDIYLINCVNYCNQKVVRSAMGNLFDVNLYTLSSTEEFVDFANKNKLNLLVADMSGENLFKINSPLSNYGVIIGNEGNGVSEQLKTLANKIVSIPMKNGLESLNAGVSCSIIIYYLDNLN
ncbi:MAG: RNA methyltransferase [Clostridia bacterium]|nr:RNA methyltransferase [Clostridia bacterium]